MASQLELQRAMNRALSAGNDLLKEQSKLVKSQLADVVGLKQVWSEMNPKQEDILKTIKTMQEALGGVDDGFEKAGASGQLMADKVSREVMKAKNLTSALKVTTEELTQKYPVAAAAVTGFVDGLVAGFKLVKNTMVKAVELAGSVAKGFWDVGKAVIAIPFRSLHALIEISNKLVPLMEAIARATEEVRKQFGDIATGAGKDVIQTARDVGVGFEKMGLGGYRVFGSLDERLQAVNRIATAMGATFEEFSKEMRDGNGAILLLQKGLGLTDENLGSIARRAKAFGSTLTAQLKQVTKFSVDFSKRFGVSQKLISRDMGMMEGDVRDFGNLAPKELAKVSVYARKLGIDVKDLLGVIDKFDTFESAAESAAMLSQAFGAQTDAIKLMKAENPANRIEELRRAFLATGKSADLLTRQELKLLAQTTGLSEETARVAFSQKNMGISMQELEKQGKVSEQRQLSTAEAVQELQSSIERVVKPFKQFASFLQAFADGFARGLLGAKDFRSMLGTLHNALRRTYEVGMQVGRAFQEMFPGVKGLIESFSDMVKTGGKFVPFAKLVGNVKTAFIDFFDAIRKGPAAVGRLFDDLQASFVEFMKSFNVGKAQGNAQAFSRTMGNIVSGIIKVVSDGAVKVMGILTDLLTGKETLNIPSTGLVGSFLDPIKEEFKTDRPLKKVGDAFVSMLKRLWEKYEDKLEPIFRKVVVGITGIIFGAAFVKMATTAFLTALSRVLLEGLISWVSEGGIASLAGPLMAIGEGIVGFITSAFIVIPAAIAAVIGSAAGVSDGMDKFNAKLQKEFGKTESMVGASTAGIIDVLTLGLVPDSLLEKIAGVVASATKSLFESIREMPFGEAMEKNLRGMVESSIEMVKSLGDIVVAFFNGDSDRIGEAAMELGEKTMTFLWSSIVDGVPFFVESLGSLLVSALGGLGKLIAWTLGQAAPWVAKELLNLMALTTGLMTGMLRKAADVFKDVPIVGSVIGWLADAGQAITGFFSWVASQVGQSIKMWKLIAGNSMGEFYSNLAGGIAQMAKDFWGWLTGWFSVDKARRLVTDFGAAVIDGLKTGLLGAKDAVGHAASGALQMFKDVWGVHSPSAEAMSIGASISKGLNDSLSSMPGTMEDIAARGLKSVSGVFEGSGVTRAFRDFTSPAVEAIKGMIDEANIISDSLKNLDPINLQARLESLADKLGIDGEKFKVKQGQVNVIINLDVTMEAEKLAKVLSEHGIVSTERTTR